MNQKKDIPILGTQSYAQNIAVNPVLAGFFFNTEPPDESYLYNLGLFNIAYGNNASYYVTALHSKDPDNNIIHVDPLFSALSQSRAESLFHYILCESLRDDEYYSINNNVGLYGSMTSIEDSILQTNSDPEILSTYKIYTPPEEKKKFNFNYLNQNLANITKLCPDIQNYPMLQLLKDENDGMISPTQFIAIKGDHITSRKNPELEKLFFYNQVADIQHDTRNSQWCVFMISENSVDIIQKQATLYSTIKTLNTFEHAFINPRLRNDESLLKLNKEYCDQHYMHWIKSAINLDITNGRNQFFGPRAN